MKIAKLGFLALVPTLLGGCVIADGPTYDSGYVTRDTYYVDGNGHRHWRRHHRYNGSYRQDGGRVYSGTYGGGAPVYPRSGSAPVISGGSHYSGSYGGGVHSAPVNPSRPSGFGRSAGVSPVPTSPAPSAPHVVRSPTATAAPAPARKIILNKPNPSVPQGPSSTHVLTPVKNQ